MVDRLKLISGYGSRMESNKRRQLPYKEALARHIKTMALAMRDAGDTSLWGKLPRSLHKVNIKTMKGWFGFAKREYVRCLRSCY